MSNRIQSNQRGGTHHAAGIKAFARWHDEWAQRGEPQRVADFVVTRDHGFDALHALLTQFESVADMARYDGLLDDDDRDAGVHQVGDDFAEGFVAAACRAVAVRS